MLVAKLAAVLFFAGIGIWGVLTPVDTCRLKITWIEGVDPDPGYYWPNCEGGCNTGSCTTHSTTGPGGSFWSCRCNGLVPNLKCRGTFSLIGGVYAIECDQNGCVNACQKLGLPPAAPGWACNCPDA